MKILFASPTYGTVDPIFIKSQRAAIMFAANHGVQWVGDASPDRMGWAAARNLIVKTAVDLGQDCDGVFWCDSDLTFPMETVAKLVSYGHDFVSAMYFQRGEPYFPLFGFFNEKVKSFVFPTQYPEDVIAPCDGVGFGCVFTSTRMLEAVSSLPECSEHGPFGGDFGKRTYGEDFLFCLRAKKVGFRPYVDTSLKCEHYIGPEFANEALFRRMSALGEVNGKVGPANP
jgi:hypothetical protein